MCGICGQYYFDNSKNMDHESIKKMTKSLVHRGPDDEGIFLNGSIGLGFRRLSIIDLDLGHQPMSDSEGLVWVVFNGEIYNFKELRKDLISNGHIFRTNCDTEVIIYGYKQWGESVLEHLNGMFSLAIWDTENKKLMLARDRAGIKPLYYKLEKNRLYFASEIKALIAADDGTPEFDPVAINLFLKYRYTPSPWTVFQGIKKLAPGNKLIFENGDSRIERWWNYSPEPFDPMPSIREAKEELLEKYKIAVKRQLISDVPLGLLLSGGLDSGLLLGLMNNFGNDWKTFTIGFGSSFKNDEISLAAYSAKALNAQNFSITLTQEDFENTLSKILSTLEEPVAASSIVLMYHICRRAREDVKVALMGQGPDELFGGYPRHIGVRYGGYWRKLPVWIRSPVKMALNILPRNETLKRGLYSLDVETRMNRYEKVFSLLPHEEIDNLFHDDLLPPDINDKIFDCWKDFNQLMEKTDELGGFQFIEIRSSLPDELLVYADKLSMAHGLEVRVPYLDHEIIEYVERLSASFKIQNGRMKYIHREVCKEILPNKILKRKKLGFETPIDNWFQKSLIAEFDNIFLNQNSLIYKFLSQKPVLKLLYDHQSRRSDYSKILFSLVVTEELMRNYD